MRLDKHYPCAIVLRIAGYGRRCSFGVTLVELLVAIGLVGIVIGITLPALMIARSSTGATASLANLHNLGMTLEAFTLANQSQYPFYPSAYPTPNSTPVYLTPLDVPGANAHACVYASLAGQ